MHKENNESIIFTRVKIINGNDSQDLEDQINRFLVRLAEDPYTITQKFDIMAPLYKAVILYYEELGRKEPITLDDRGDPITVKGKKKGRNTVAVKEVGKLIVNATNNNNTKTKRSKKKK